MAICGWCKSGDLQVDKKTRNLEPHTRPNTTKTECKGWETYRDLGPDGRSLRGKS